MKPVIDQVWYGIMEPIRNQIDDDLIGYQAFDQVEGGLVGQIEIRIGMEIRSRIAGHMLTELTRLRLRAAPGLRLAGTAQKLPPPSGPFEPRQPRRGQ